MHGAQATKGINMLLLTLNSQNQITLAGGITIQLGKVSGSKQAQILIEAPKDVMIRREPKGHLNQK